MREELIALLEEAFEAGIITSTIQSQIDALKKKIKLTDAEYQVIEDRIRIDAYLHKVKEREKKGVTFMGDLRKQYKITDDDKITIQGILSAEPKTAAAVKPQEAASKPEQPKKQEPLKQPEPAKTPATPAGQEKKIVSPRQTESPRKPESAKQSEVLRKSDLLKEHAHMPEPEPEKKPEVPKKQEPSKKSETKKTSAEPPLILVADDNETQLFLTKSALEESGYSCITTDTPETAVRIISEKQPALVICDINFGIGKPTGLDVFTNIRTKKITVPFIIVSAFIQKEFMDHAKRIGVTDYITKPTDYDDLIAIVKKYIHD